MSCYEHAWYDVNDEMSMHESISCTDITWSHEMRKERNNNDDDDDQPMSLCTR